MDLVLGIDPSTKCGWGLLTLTGKRVDSGTFPLAPTKREGDGARFFKLHSSLTFVKMGLRDCSLTVAYEVPGGHFESQAAMLAIVGLAAHVESWCEREHLVYVGFAPAEVKRAAGLKGNAKKPEMVAAANARWAPHTFKADEADACFIALALLKERGCVS